MNSLSMKHRVAIVLTLPIFLFAGPETALDWQTGKITDAKSVQHEPMAGDGIIPKVSQMKKHEFTEYAIETDKYTYTIELKGRPHVIINDQVKFATDKGIIWMIDADNQKRKAKILRQTLKELGR